MKKVLVLVEGQTEERFVKDVFYPHLHQSGIYLIPKIATTKRVKSGPDFKGGIISYERVRNDIIRLLRDTNAACVTTMFDLYGLPSEFPGKSTASGDPYAKVRTVEQAFEQDINHPRFLGNLILHEFEGLLFIEPSQIARTLNQPPKEQTLQEIRNAFHTPEEINDSRLTSPSKRIINIFPQYQKVVHGNIISRRIGMNAIRENCPHFDEWVTRLEEL